MAQQAKNEMNLIRIAGTDINAESTILYGIAKIKGVSQMFANAVCVALGLDKNAKISSLSEKDIEKLEEFLTNPKKEGIPIWLLNQRKDYESGENLHLTTKDIEFNEMQMKRRTGKIKTYKAQRAKLKLPVRGQRTKANFRRNKTLAHIKSKSTGGKK
jgi:small subunit ribosomal protein S13